MAHYPRKERSTSTWLESGDYVQKTWSWAQLTRYIVSANEQLQLWDDAGAVQISATVMSPPSGWFVASHQFATDNDETGYRVQSGSTELAQVRPWHGFFAHVGLEAETAANGNVWHDKSRGNRHVRGYTSKGNLQIERSQNSVPFAWDLTPDVIEDVDWSCGRFDRLSEDQTLWLVCEIAGSIEVFTSTDEGRTFTLSITVASGSKPTLVIGPDRRRHFFWIDGTAIKGRVYDAFGTLLEATFTAVASGVDDQGIAAEVRTVQDGEYRIVLTYVSSGSIIAVESTNSTTFS